MPSLLCSSEPPGKTRSPAGGWWEVQGVLGLREGEGQERGR